MDNYTEALVQDVKDNFKGLYAFLDSMVKNDVEKQTKVITMLKGYDIQDINVLENLLITYKLDSECPRVNDPKFSEMIGHEGFQMFLQLLKLILMVKQ
jgi:hypothetical protein